MPASAPARADKRLADVAPAAGLACAVLLLTFITAGGTDLGPNTWAEIALVLAGAATCAWALGAGLAWRRPLGASVVLFGAVTVLTALSISWSVTPDQSWTEAGRTLSYFAAFAAAAALAQRLPHRWAAVTTAVALLATAVALWAALVKVFTWQLYGQVGYGRLLAPYGYWNATGLIGALGMPAALWAASRREGSQLVRAAAVAAVALLISVDVLSYSRSALLAAVIGLAPQLALGRTRLRAALALIIGCAGATVICGWALSDHAFTSDSVALSARVAAGHGFGIVAVLALLGTGAVAYRALTAADRAQLDDRARRTIGKALIGLLALVPIALLGELLASRRGLTGEISHVWSTLTSTGSGVGFSPSRLASVANSRPAYWHQAFSVGAHHLLAGAGADAFGVAELAYSTRTLIPLDAPQGHAHSYVMQTFADFGLIGLALNLALLAVWIRATRRALSHAGATAGQPERDALLALVGTVVAFGASSSIDWTWFVPGVTVPALICAGWLAGRGSSAAPQARPLPQRRLLERPRAILALSGLAVVTLALCYAVWQPQRSVQADDDAVAAEVNGDYRAALADAQTAVNDFPVSLPALQQLSALEGAVGNGTEARAALVKATSEQPENPASWIALGCYELNAHEYTAAHASLSRATRYDWFDPTLFADIYQAIVGQQDAAEHAVDARRTGTTCSA